MKSPVPNPPTPADECARAIVDVVMDRLDIPPFDDDWPLLVRAINSLPGDWRQKSCEAIRDAAMAVDLDDVLQEPLLWTGHYLPMLLNLAAMLMVVGDAEPDRRLRLQRTYSAACRAVRFLEGRTSVS